MSQGIIFFSVFFVGFVHSLSPGHWFPIALLAKSKKWSLQESILGALVAASGHIALSVVIGWLSYAVQRNFFQIDPHALESISAILLIIFGSIYAGMAFAQHSHCKGHTHHGPKPNLMNPYLFLFSIGFSPCFAVLPVFISLWSAGLYALLGGFVVFSLGVISAFCLTVILAHFGLPKFDHPLFEHYGNVITGIGVALLGAVLLVLPFLGVHTH